MVELERDSLIVSYDNVDEPEGIETRGHDFVWIFVLDLRVLGLL